jgi:hypothetical protein
MTATLSRRDRRDIRPGHNELAVRAGGHRPASGHRYRLIIGKGLAVGKKLGRRLGRNQAQPVPAGVHPLAQIHGWKSDSDWYKSFGGEANYRSAMARLLDRQRGVGSIVYSVERAIEAKFPSATEEEWHGLAHIIVDEIICPSLDESGAWRISPVTNADVRFGRRESERASTRWRQPSDHPHRPEEETHEH